MNTSIHYTIHFLSIQFNAYILVMWDHPFTAKHLKELESLGIQVIPPVVKTLACNETGNGAMAEVPTIVAAVKNALHL